MTGRSKAVMIVFLKVKFKRFVQGSQKIRFYPNSIKQKYDFNSYIHTYFIGSSPRGFSESILHYKIINQVHDNKNITMKKEDKGQ